MLGLTRTNETKRNYAIMKLNVPKRVVLPNCRTFVARCKRISRGGLPPNIVMLELIGKDQEVVDEGKEVAKKLPKTH